MGNWVWVTIINKIYRSQLNLIDIISIHCGYGHTVALVKADNSKSNECYVWGNNTRGQLALGHNQNQNKPQKLYLLHIISVSCGGYHTIALTQIGTLYVWGLNTEGQLGLGFYGGNNSFPQKLNLYEPIISISCGANHTICVTAKNKIYVWGDNEHYQLGLGDTINQSSPQQLKI